MRANLPVEAPAVSLQSADDVSNLRVMVQDEGGPAVLELVRQVAFAAPSKDPAKEMSEGLVHRTSSRQALGDVLADCGYSNREPETFSLPLRHAGARLVMDLHPADRGQKGTYMGAVAANGNLYCPCTPEALLELGPLARGASEEETRAHDERCAEFARFKLGRISVKDETVSTRHVTGCDGEAPLPAATRVHGARLLPPRGALASRASAHLLRPADDQRPGEREREDRPEARLPLEGPPHLLCAPHRIRARLRLAL